MGNRRRWASVLGLTVAAATTLAALLPSAVSAQAPVQDTAAGNPCWGPPGPFVFGPCATFDARSGPQGEMPTGSVDVSARQNFAGGPVTCLTVTGNRATVGFAEVFRPDDGLDGGFLFVEDNGSPGVGRDAVLFNLVAEPPSVCPANTVAYGSDDRLYFGDIAVQDAQPSPASKHQCKHGGWVQFGFRNQGQCVAFVQHRPQP